RGADHEMEQSADPRSRRELVQRVQDQGKGSGPEAARRVTRPRATRAEGHGESAERDPPSQTVRTPRQGYTSGDQPGARDDPGEARPEVARARDRPERPPRGRVTQDGELDGLRQRLRAGYDGGASRRQP